MAHSPKESFQDIPGVLRALRELPRIQEKGFAVFYLKSKPFLHFHISDGKRWADAKTKTGDWGKPIILPFTPSRTAVSSFLKEVEKRHKAILTPVKAGPK